ncbi:hypothetical protein A9K55_006758 [Cordyceps militaris]|uniref:Uncharacterized protein n=1 Tax=Cordyceps militaris TaxID=73501 RepID=A0A2H4SCH9_CORMI|nr:hypothetical protein A9K55_006758 [Cordyceps militaris]
MLLPFQGRTTRKSGGAAGEQKPLTMHFCFSINFFVRLETASSHTPLNMKSLLNLSNEILGDIIVLALELNDTRLPLRYRCGILYTDFRCRRYGYYKDFWCLLHSCRRLRECTFDQMLQRANFVIHETTGLQLLVADFRRNGFLSRLKNLDFCFSTEEYDGIYGGNNRDLESRAALTDVAAILSQLPAGLRRLEMNFITDETGLDFGAPLPSLIRALHRFQELEELLWYCDLSLFDFEWYPAAPPFGQWTTVADCYKRSTNPDYVKDIPRDRFQDIPFTIPRDKPAFPALSRLTLTSTIVLLPHQMAEALSAQQLPSLTCLHFLNIRWPYNPDDMDPVEWPIARRCFARMNALTEFRWEADDVTTRFQSLEGPPECHIPPTAEINEQSTIPGLGYTGKEDRRSPSRSLSTVCWKRKASI